MPGADDLKKHFDTIGLPPVVQSWLLDLWNVIQVFDDAYDGDKASRADVTRALWSVFQTMPLNDFYREYQMVLQPVVWLQILKWQAANQIEEQGFANEKSWMWRAGYYEVVLMCCHLSGINDAGHACSEMYGETLPEYLAEFGRNVREVA